MISLLTVIEAAKVLRFSTGTFHRKIALGEVPHHRLGKKIFLTTQDIEQYLEKCAVPATKGG